jgi:hypothetical protein
MLYDFEGKESSSVCYISILLQVARRPFPGTVPWAPIFSSEPSRRPLHRFDKTLHERQMYAIGLVGMGRQ